VTAISIEQVLVEEAHAIHGAREKSAIEALRAHASAQPAESRRARKDADTRSGVDEDPADVERRKAFYRALNKLNRAALCCSGGGIRSATFCLGVIQALAMHSLTKTPPGASTTSSQSADDVAERANHSLLSRFHYLSTVSGGGYIGSWLSAWRTRNDFPTVWSNLTGRPEGPDIEPPEISWLRSYSNYLTPKVGIGSADTWTGAAIFLRNLLLNWLVIVPAVALVLLVLKLIATISIAVARMQDVWWPHVLIALVGIAFLIVAQAFTTGYRPTRRKLDGTLPSAEAGNVDQSTFLCRDLLWSLLSAIFLTSFLTSHVGAELARNLSTYWAIVIGAIIGVVIFAAGWLAGLPLRWEAKDLGLWAVSGVVYGGLLGFGAHLYTTLLSPYTGDTGDDSIWIILIPVILGVPWVLASQLFAEMIFVGLVSYEVNSDADREWLGRGAGWIAATAVIWALTTFISFAGGHFLIDVEAWLAPYIASAGGVAGIAAALIGKSAQTTAKPNEEDQSLKAIVFKIGLAIAGPIFAAVLVVGISVALDLLLLGDSLVQGLTKHIWTTGYIVFWLLVGVLATVFVAAVASRNVNINRFSIHALYRNRLVRAYLGASRQRRSPDLFTGFDDHDNLPAHKLWPPKPRPNGENTFSLFHVVNITLNLVQAKRLAWQQRKAESFTVSALHCGAAYKGFRPSVEYGGGSPFGLSLGTAMAISGAAASPNMGYHSSPSITLLLALFNVRLGWWLGNPGPEGEKTYKDEGPATAIVPLVEETFGQTTDDKPYVYLSDGGHFENLGLYEMVRRRCRFIVSIDAGCDPEFTFVDLGNAVRKIFIDLGIRIRFKGLDKLKNRPAAEQLNAADGKIPYYAVGKINYRDADGDCEDGWILYIKPAIHGTDTEGAGVRSYATAQKTFPHESTADQWFSESQFESYRSLGLDIMSSILRGGEEDFDHRTLEQILAGLTQTVHA
jgi:Patatin-like phospholipase